MLQGLLPSTISLLYSALSGILSCLHLHRHVEAENYNLILKLNSLLSKHSIKSCGMGMVYSKFDQDIADWNQCGLPITDGSITLRVFQRLPQATAHISRRNTI